MNEIVSMFSYEFMVRALIAGVLVALSAGLVGVPVVLRKNAMIGDGLSHVAFLAFALATVMGLMPLGFAIPMVIVASFIIVGLGSRTKSSGDSLIAIASATALALGVLIISVAGVNFDINSYLFGSVLAVGWSDVVVSLILVAILTALYIVFYRQIFAVTFDAKFAKSVGIKVNLYEMIFAALCSVVIVLGMKIAGALLIASLLVFPAMSARLIMKSFKGTTVVSALLAVLGVIIGLVLSYVLAVPTGAVIVLTNFVILVIFKIVSIFSV